MTNHDPAGTDQTTLMLNTLNVHLYRNDRKTEDLYGLNLLQNLIQGHPQLPFTGAAMRPYCLIHVINDILVNKREKIIEFGCGVSTVLLARLIKLNDLKATIISIEHIEGWGMEINRKLAQEGLQDIAKVIHVPLGKCELAVEDNEWYLTDILEKELKDLHFDMVIVDGPPAWQASKGMSRYPAFPFIASSLSERFSIYLDDANRPGERAVLQGWTENYGMTFNISGASFAYYYNGEAYFTEPMTQF